MSALLRPWANILKAWDEGPTLPWSVLDQILEDGPDPSAIEMSFRALEKALAAKPSGVDCGQAFVLVDLAKAFKDPDLALAYAARLAALAARVNFVLSFPMLFFMGAASHYPLFGR